MRLLRLNLVLCTVNVLLVFLADNNKLSMSFFIFKLSSLISSIVSMENLERLFSSSVFNTVNPDIIMLKGVRNS